MFEIKLLNVAYQNLLSFAMLKPEFGLIPALDLNYRMNHIFDIKIHS